MTRNSGPRCRYKRAACNGLTNGIIGTLVGIEPDGVDWLFTVAGDDNRTHRLRRSAYCDEHGRLHLMHAYASTIYAAQGLTVDEAFVLHDVQMDRAAAYVAGSRHRDQCEWFCNGKALDELHPATNDGERIQHLAEMLSTDRYQALALEHWERLPRAPEPTREPQHELEQT